LTDLPTELLLKIIPHVLPEGFENFAITCRTLYELFTPFIEHHNRLRSQFQNFIYREWSRDPLLSPIRTAFDLIKRIAIEPIVARYIREANFYRDSFPPRARLRQVVPDVHDGGPVVTLFAESAYLRQAGLDWKEYYALIKEDLKHNDDYSQEAAAFILTLLPNVKALTLPRLWKPLDKTGKLVDAIVRETRQLHLQLDRPSLAQVTKFESSSWSGPVHRFDLDKAVSFLALPHVRWFCSPSCVAIGDCPLAFASKDPYLRYGEALQTAHFVRCCIDEVAIADFVKHTPHLRMIRYSHSTIGDDNKDWNICKFVTAIENGAGNYLEELSISITELRGSIITGRASMRGFQRLRKLEFPLEIVMCNITDAVSRAATSNESLVDQGLEKFSTFIGDLIPASVSHLSLLSSGNDNHERALNVMFHNFAAKKDSQLPALKEIYLSCPGGASGDNIYKEECKRLVIEVEKAGVAL
ncbi:F-box domain protein, partial [Tricladium varicosporioides]